MRPSQGFGKKDIYFRGTGNKSQILRGTGEQRQNRETGNIRKQFFYFWGTREQLPLWEGLFNMLAPPPPLPPPFRPTLCENNIKRDIVHNPSELDSRPRGRGFQPHRRNCVVSLSKNINPSLVLVQHTKTRPFITERLLMGHKESNQRKQTILLNPFCIKFVTI